LIIHSLKPKLGLASVTTETVDDLWALRRLLEPGDIITSRTTRAAKRQGEFTRPDKGERIKVTMTLQVDSVKMDGDLERLRVHGRVLASSDELVPRSSYHSITIIPSRSIGIKKGRMEPLHMKLLRQTAQNEQTFIIIALDHREAAMGRLKSTTLTIFPGIESDAGGKQYLGSQGSGSRYFSEIISQMKKILRGGEEVIIVGPGESKRKLMNLLLLEDPQLRGRVQLVEGLDGTGHDGVLLAMRSPILRSRLQKSRLSSAAEILDEAMRRIGAGDRRVAMTFPEASKAAMQGAVDKVLVSSNIMSFNVEEGSLVEFLNTVESHGGGVYLLDGSTDVGIQVSALKGVVALLRFPVG